MQFVNFYYSNKLIYLILSKKSLIVFGDYSADSLMEIYQNDSIYVKHIIKHRKILDSFSL